MTRRVRPLLVLVALGVTALVVPNTAAATPDSHPSVADVQRQLGELALQNTQLVEQFDQAQIAVKTKQQAADRAEQAAATADAAFETARTQLSATATAMYEGGSFSATGAFLSSDSGQNYLDQLQTLSMLSSHTAQVVHGLQIVQRKATDAREHADAMLAVATTKRDELAEKRATVDKQIKKYTSLLNTLTAAQRAAYLRQVNPQVSSAQVAALRSGSVHATTAAAAQAVKYALAQVGKPYVYGAAGPGSYDCSGLTMAAWASAGVSLPHSAAGQYNYGTHVSFNSLQPGDLLFFYRPIGHVTIYVGDGLMVSAPQSGENVSVIPATTFGSDYVGATRLTD